MYNPKETSQDLNDISQSYNKKFADNEYSENMLYTQTAVNSSRKKIFKKHKKTAMILAASLVVAIVPTAVLGMVQHDNMEKATEVAHVVDVPFSDNYDLIILNNGTAYYENAEGGKTTSINGVTASEFAKNLGYDVAEYQEQSPKAK